MANTKNTQKSSGPASSVAEVVAALRKLDPKTKFKSASELIDVACPGTKKSVGQRVRQLKRDNDEKVGKGKTYVDCTAADFIKLYEDAQAEKANKTQAKATASSGKAKPKAKATA